MATYKKYFKYYDEDTGELKTEEIIRSLNSVIKDFEDGLDGDKVYITSNVLKGLSDDLQEWIEEFTEYIDFAPDYIDSEQMTCEKCCYFSPIKGRENLGYCLCDRVNHGFTFRYERPCEFLKRRL